jgi:Ricin-type beta-trefoil lectin domain/Ricin-type beta-trefoil lectin domain-like
MTKLDALGVHDRIGSMTNVTPDWALALGWLRDARAGSFKMIALALLVAGALTWNICGARAQFPPPTGPIHVLQSGRCLDADTGTIGANGTKVQLWDCSNGGNQHWVMNTNGTIVNVQSNRCLDADTGTIGNNGAKMQLWDCWGGQNQNWSMNADGTITNAKSSQCLNADTGTIGGNGTKVQLWSCTHAANQKWWSPEQNGPQIRVQQSGRCLDADTGTIVNNGTTVQLWDCTGSQNQKWAIILNGTIINLESHRCLDADTGTIGNNGAKMQLWDCWGGQNQNWLWPGYDPGGGNTGSAMRNAKSNQCLDADTGTIGANGTKVQLWACSGGRNQFWLNPAPAQ